MPMRSTGCHKCRARKIRCDETRPSCLKCAIHGVACPGYKTAQAGDFEILDLTASTAQRAKRKPRPRDPSRARSNQEADVSNRKRESITAADDASRKPTNQADGTASGSQEYITPSSSHLRQIQSPAAHRTQLYSTFIRLFTPNDVRLRVEAPDPSLKLLHLDYPTVLTTEHAPHPALVHALDALSLVQIGSIDRSRQYLFQGVNAYARSLRALANALSNPEGIFDDHLLAAAKILSVCEWFDEIKQQGKGWINHQKGMQKLIEARGPGSINTHWSRLLYWNTANGMLTMALLHRKESMLLGSGTAWRELDVELLPSCEDGYGIVIGRHLVQLLERHDQLDHSDPGSLQAVNSLIADFEDLSTVMRTHYDPYFSTQLRLKPMSHFASFAAAVPDRTFTHAYDCPSYVFACKYVQCWVRWYYLRADMHSLYAHRDLLCSAAGSGSFCPSHSTSSNLPHDHHVQEAPYGLVPLTPNAEAEAELLDAVHNLCRTVPYLVDPASGTAAHITSFLPLHVATCHFSSRGLWSSVRWARRVRASVFVRGISMPTPRQMELSDDADYEQPSPEGADELATAMTARLSGQYQSGEPGC